MTDSFDWPCAGTRPKAPKIDGATADHRSHGRRLAAIHALYLQELGRLRRAMERAMAGDGRLGDLRAAVSSMQMMSNVRQYGVLCGRQCAALTMHHTIEDQAIFPALHGREAGLTAVVERLMAEHLVIHDLLEKLEAAAIDTIKAPGPDTFAHLRTAFETMEEAVRSHFGYEQEELEEAIGYWNVPL